MSGERDSHYTKETPGGVPSCKGFEEDKVHSGVKTEVAGHAFLNLCVHW